jgi:two-component system alkaline phosphatase synthesis response regulator PhoP
MKHTTKILIIEDDPSIRELARYNLQEEGYLCEEAGDGLSGLAAAVRKEGAPDLVLLDIMLPGIDGYEVLRRLRTAGSTVPVIMLSAKNEEVDKVLGLEFGADDYITKPFGVRELKARIRAVLRRYDAEAAGADGDVLTIGALTIDVPRHEVREGGRLLDLTLKEFDLLLTLVKNRGLVLTREQLLDKVWGYDYLGETRTVDVHIRYLRRKLGGAEDRYIATVRGLGYKVI